MRIVTAGWRYQDIDAYAGIIAYAELLNALGVPAKAVSTAPLNQSIPPIVREWKVPYATTYTPSPDDTFTLIDVSESEFFEKFVDPEHIDEVIDHHPGLEDYWQERIGDGALIEAVGAACTQVFEQWEQAGLADHISETSARLLMCGILDNTLNFTADVTTNRDKRAYATLAEHANLPDDWPAQYFSACQEAIMQDIHEAVATDTKVMKLSTYDHLLAVGQLAVWDAGDLATKSFETFKQVIAAKEPNWFINIIGISDGKSYFVTDVPEVKTWLEDLLGVLFDGHVATANRSWLRKEILKADLDRDMQKVE